MSDSSHLVRMVCDIANFFATEQDNEAAVNGIVNHLEKFWDPRMRRKLIAGFPAVSHEMPPIARAAVERLAKSASLQEACGSIPH